MARSIAFFVEGVPVSQGSKVSIPVGWRPGQLDRPRMKLVESANLGRRKRLKHWRELVTYHAAQAIRGERAFEGAVLLTAQFIFERPKSHFTRAGDLRGSAPRNAISKRLGDLCKLVRAIEDSITDAGVWGDDVQVVGYPGTGKRWAHRGESCGVYVQITGEI